MLILNNLTIKDKKNYTFIEKLNYSLGNNDKLGVIGEEGNGKSTLLKAIYNKALLDDYATISGEIDTDFKHIGYFEQQLSSCWENYQVYEYLLKERIDSEIEIEQYNELHEYEELSVTLNIPVELIQSEQTIKTLSGGEKVKLRLLKLLHQPVDLLLLDEPTNDLDIETLEWLENFLLHLNIPVIFISHDEILLERVANVILHLEQLNKKTKCRYTVYRGGYSDYVVTRGDKLTKDKQIARKEKQDYLKKKERMNNIMNAVHDALNDTVRSPLVAKNLKTKMASIKAQEKRFEKEGYSRVDTVEEAIDIYFEVSPLPTQKIILEKTWDEISIKGRCLLKDVSIHLYGQDKIVLVGPNGSGKSILIKMIYEEIKKRDDIHLGYMPQTYIDEFALDDTPITFLQEEGDQQDITRCRELLGRMKFTTEEMTHSVLELSEGQKAKLFLLRFIKYGCNVLLLDEPTRNLSPLSNPIIRGILQDFQGCIFAISHDRKFIEEVFDQQFYINKQSIILKKV